MNIDMEMEEINEDIINEAIDAIRNDQPLKALYILHSYFVKYKIGGMEGKLYPCKHITMEDIEKWRNK